MPAEPADGDGGGPDPRFKDILKLFRCGAIAAKRVSCSAADGGIVDDFTDDNNRNGVGSLYFRTDTVSELLTTNVFNSCCERRGGNGGFEELSLITYAGYRLERATMTTTTN